MKKAGFSILYLIYFFTSLNAQNLNLSSSFSLALNFYTGFPQKEFKENINRNGYGINFEGSWKPVTSLPFSLGLNFGVLNYGSITRREPFSYTIPDVFVDVTTQNNLLNYHIVAQIDKQIGIIKPYFQLLIGGAYIYTETKIENRKDHHEIASSTNFEDYAFSTGFGGGAMFRISKNEAIVGKMKTYNELFLNIKFSYLFGSNAKYLKEGSIKYTDNGKITYDVLESKTDLFGLHLGVVFTF
ncbi:MAG: hypothetical protein ACPL25_03310 [Ignavibacteria bacterium]